MEGAKIGAVNTAIEELIPAIREVSDKDEDAQIEIAVLSFSTGVTWHTPDGPVPAEEFRWKDLAAGGASDLGAACKALNEKLSTKAFMQEPGGFFAPVILLFSDGNYTDDWEQELRELKKNRWFKIALKAAVAIGNYANKDVLKEFTGSMEAVLEAHNTAMLKKMIRPFDWMDSVMDYPDEDEEAAEDEATQEALNTVLSEFSAEAAAMSDEEGW
jgi:uncharacterized protein YegL